METPIKSVLSILNRELKLANKLESQAILSQIIVEVKTNIVPEENKNMEEMFDTGFSMGCDYALNDRGNMTGKEWLLRKNSEKIIHCEICDSEVLPNCEYYNCPNN